MAEMGLTSTDRWHLLGKHACQHVKGADFVATREFDEQALTDPEWGSIGVPRDLGGTDARWCRHCERTIRDMKSSRFNSIVDLKRVVPYRDISWRTVDCAGDCPWCGKAGSATQYDDELDVTVCPACACHYDTPGTEVEDPPETDRRVERPADEVGPVRYTYYTGNAERPADEPSPSESRKATRQRAADERRPYVEVKVKGKYADVVCDIAGTGHRFTPDAVKEIEALQSEQKEKTEADPDHRSYVRTDIGSRGTYVQTSTLFPGDARQHADDLAAIAADPTNWQ
jgi:hypothetical protein